MPQDRIKQYNSVFLPGEKVDVANFIVEIIIKNYLGMIKKTVPNCPFWRKEIAQNNPFLEELAKRYTVELGGIKKLLKTYEPSVIIKYYTESKRTGFKLLKKENQTIILKELDKAQKIYLQSLEKQNDIPQLEFKEVSSFKPVKDFGKKKNISL